MVNQKWIFNESALYGLKKGEFWSLNLSDESISHSIALTLIKSIVKYYGKPAAEEPETASLLPVSGAHQRHRFCPPDHWLLTPMTLPRAPPCSPSSLGLHFTALFLPFASWPRMLFTFSLAFPLAWIILPLDTQMLLSLWHTFLDHPYLKFHARNPSSWLIFLLSPYHNLTNYTFCISRLYIRTKASCR